ncbi:MAG: hypothetical protein IKZ84_10360 [Victivallales bacterium]|nr:hypothetical protein [Victivallales bacterium]
MKKHALLFAAVLAACLFTSCKALEPRNANVPPPAPVDGVIIPDIVITPAAQLPLPKVQKAVMDAAMTRDWIPKVTAPNVVRCDLSVRGKHRIVVDVLLAPDTITFRYVTSENMNYDPVKRTIHRKYEGWVRMLAMEINKEIVRVDAQK